ncbi:hypothetical protein PC123_g23332 [Phytophthora cactorum]|nr:hypothetical protein PC123_g23332 [Phytophthora cactorum]
MTFELAAKATRLRPARDSSFDLSSKNASNRKCDCIQKCLHNATTSSSVTTARVHRVVHPFELPPGGTTLRRPFTARTHTGAVCATDAKHWLVVATDQGDPYRDVHWRCARISDSILMR